MTTPTDTQYKTLIIAQVGDDEQQTLARMMEGIWLLHSVYAPVTGLRYLYALRSAIEFMQGTVRNLVDADLDNEKNVKMSQRFKHLQDMYDNTTSEITRIESAYLAARNARPAYGVITKRAPIENPYVDTTTASEIDRRLRGDAYLSGGWTP